MSTVNPVRTYVLESCEFVVPPARMKHLSLVRRVVVMLERELFQSIAYILCSVDPDDLPQC